MPPQLTVSEIRLNNITACVTAALDTLDILANSLNTPFLAAITSTTQSLLKNIQTVKQNKDDCANLMEQIHELLNAIIVAHINSDTGGELPPMMLRHIGKFAE
ncbi:hypothetical protein B0H13DRAFT_2333143 [Mycena leptocephala]|nr:hypothetical protein B0H13DRAFT_2333143 [Mycena leptocephala]